MCAGWHHCSSLMRYEQLPSDVFFVNLLIGLMVSCFRNDAETKSNGKLVHLLALIVLKKLDLLLS